MIRRILHAELSDVRVLASEAKRRAVNAYRRNFCLFVGDGYATIEVGRTRGILALRGAGYIVDDRHADNWPDGARLLTIGRVTLAAWGRAKKGVDS